MTRGTRHIVGEMGTNLVAPELARFIARHYGPRGRAWLETLPRRIERYRAEWELEVEKALPTGFSSCCLAVSTTAGEAAVLKLSGPWTPAATRGTRFENLERWTGSATTACRRDRRRRLAPRARHSWRAALQPNRRSHRESRGAHRQSSHGARFGRRCTASPVVDRRGRDSDHDGGSRGSGALVRRGIGARAPSRKSTRPRSKAVVFRERRCDFAAWRP
jgi:hypothetical protein